MKHDSSGLLAEYATGDALCAAARAIRERGYTALDAFTPYPLHDFEHALGMKRSKLPFIAFGAALCGAGGAYLLQWWIAAVDYPLNVGGRPQHAALAFVPITFEMGVLFTAFTAFIAVLVFGGLPRLWHPVFQAPGFERASIDRFWLAIETRDPKFDRTRTAADLAATGPLQVVYVGQDGAEVIDDTPDDGGAGDSDA